METDMVLPSRWNALDTDGHLISWRNPCDRADSDTVMTASSGANPIALVEAFCECGECVANPGFVDPIVGYVFVDDPIGE